VRVRATYPFVRVTTATHARLDSRLSYGFVAGPGVLNRVMRTGTVASVDNRNWEIGDPAYIRRLSQSRAVALDMESATIAANGFRFRVPYGTLLCVSDKPLHGEIKLAGMAGDFSRHRIGQHLEIGLKALESSSPRTGNACIRASSEALLRSHFNNCPSRSIALRDHRS
jgi:nucleoside phosphorylase